MSQVLVSVRFQGYYLQLLINKDSTISQLVTAMRQNTFIPNNISDDRLRYKTSSNKQVRLHDQVKSIIQSQQNNVHYLQVQVVQENPKQNTATTANQGQNARAANQTNRILQRIVEYLKGQQTRSLVRARQNPRIQARMAEYLTQIGLAVEKIQKKGQYLENGLKKLLQMNKQSLQSSSNQIMKEFQIQGYNQTHQCSVPADYYNLIDGVYRLRKNESNNQLVQTQFNQAQLKIHSKDQQLTELRTKISNLQSRLTHTESQKKSLNSKISELQQILSTSDDKNQRLQRDLKLSQQKFKDIQKSLNQQKQNSTAELLQKVNENDSLQTQVNNLQQNLEQMRVKILMEQAAKAEQAEQMQTINRQPSRFQKVKVNNFLNFVKKSQINKSLLQNLQKQKDSQIFQINQLMSYDIQNQRSGSVDFHEILHNKASLLLIAITENNKIVGAFTEEKITIEPEDYFQIDFSGLSFLFSVIFGETSFFKLKQNEISLLYDFDKLIFGNTDLVLDFKKKVLTSKFVISSFEASHYAKDNHKQEKPFQLLLKDTKKDESVATSVKIIGYRIYEVIFANDKN